MSDVLCGVPGLSTVGPSSESSPQALAEGVQRALAELKLPPLDQVVAAASERMLAPQ